MSDQNIKPDERTQNLKVDQNMNVGESIRGDLNMNIDQSIRAHENLKADLNIDADERRSKKKIDESTPKCEGRSR